MVRELTLTELLRQGAEEWNQYRAQHPEKIPFFGTDFPPIPYKDYNFSGAQFVGTRFSDAASPDKASFYDCDFRRAHFNGVQGAYVNFCHNQMEGATFDSHIPDNARQVEDEQPSDLRGANFKDSSGLAPDSFLNVIFEKTTMPNDEYVSSHEELAADPHYFKPTVPETAVAIVGSRKVHYPRDGSYAARLSSEQETQNAALTILN